MTEAMLLERDEFLRECGFDSYSDYLTSDLWAWIISNLGEIDRFKTCCACKSTTGLVWHHNDYSPSVLVGNFSSESNEVVRLCRPCHRAVHYNSKGEFVDLLRVGYRFENLVEWLDERNRDGGSVDEARGRFVESYDNHPTHEEFVLDPEDGN